MKYVCHQANGRIFFTRTISIERRAKEGGGLKKRAVPVRSAPSVDGGIICFKSRFNRKNVRMKEKAWDTGKEYQIPPNPKKTNKMRAEGACIAPCLDRETMIADVDLPRV
jgi:hypothetical protein